MKPEYSAVPQCSTGEASTDYETQLPLQQPSPKWNMTRSTIGAKLNTGAKRIICLTFLYGGIYGAIDQLLPACYKSLERDMSFTPQALGFASSASRIAHVMTCPIWGFVIDCCGRRRIFSSTCLGWGVAAACFLYVTQQWHVLVLMCHLGLFTSAMGPLCQKVIAQEVSERQRGGQFGALHFYQSLGRVVALMITTSFSGYMLLGIEGWRHAFALFGLLSVTIGILLAVRVSDCPVQKEFQKVNGKGFTLRDTAYVFSNGSLWVMLLMGILNGVPRSAVHFSTMYFQYCGIPDFWASSLVSSSWIAAMLVAPFVGSVGDYVHSKYPHHGRQCLAQICIAMRSILMAVMLTCIPRNASSLPVLFVFGILIGLLAGWPGVGVNRPILTEIVRPEHRASTFALFSCFEGIGAALLGAPLVGYLSENVFGYIEPAHLGTLIASSEEMQEKNARAISLSMLCMTVGPWILSILVYGMLHMTYKSDQRYGTALQDSSSHAPEGATEGPESRTLRKR